ncbi:MAG: DUF692 domain-containing protein [Crocinitomicaceae bacterium]
MKNYQVGLGYRRDISEEIMSLASGTIDFIELAPENWMNIGGQWKKDLKAAAEKYPMTVHGLSLSIGSPDELDIPFLKQVKAFLDEYNIDIYSEHLSYSKCDNAHLYDLLPIPFRKDAVKHIVKRIQQVQDILERELVLENVSYYSAIAPEMDEVDFINAILEESNCGMLLDVNNIYVNAFNHKYDIDDFINRLNLQRTRYIHIAGHEKVSDTLIIDTHGQAIIDPVYEILEKVVDKIKPVPVLLERDFNFPQFDELIGEIKQIRSIINKVEA